MIGSTFGHYRILEKLGQEGMGEVFLAEDTSLQRKVGLKFLPPGLQQDDAARKRFLREARSAAAVAAMGALLAALDVGGVRGRLTGGAVGEAAAIRLAVLPFVNLTGDPEQEYLTDGLTEEMITQLGRLHPGRLSVIGRPSVMRYKGGETPIDQIGRELGVQYVLAGSARRESARVRVNAELIRVQGQTQLWSEAYDRDLSGILSLQNDLARQVARALALRLLPEEEARLANVLTWGDWDWPAAERQWNRVRELAPNHPETLAGHAHFLLLTGHPQEALAESERAVLLDPFNTKSLGFHAMTLLGLRRYADAIAAAREAMRLQSDAPVARSALCAALFLTGQFEEALELDRERAAANPELEAALEMGYAEGGYAGAQRRLADALAGRSGEPGGGRAWDLANRYLYAGDRDRSLEWLERACEEGNGNVPYISLPTWDAVRPDPRFQDIRRRVGLPG